MVKKRKKDISELLTDCQSFVTRNNLQNDKVVLRTIDMKSRDYCIIILMKRMNVTYL